ncbi:MAG: flagellar protein export ATPase FliI [Rhodospirillales bacterium]|nr:flagellar protein export ATPase FliI [Rhodospirillales bacterium]
MGQAELTRIDTKGRVPVFPAVSAAIRAIDHLPDATAYGRISGIVGLLIEVDGLDGCLAVGDRCRLYRRGMSAIQAEVVGFRAGKALLMPLSGVEGLGPGSRAELVGGAPVIHPSLAWCGRVLNAFAEPLDGRGALAPGSTAYGLRNPPPPAHLRQRIGGKLDVGVRAINAFTTCCRGQRLGIFAASGVGKSMLLSMMARHTGADVVVIGLIGERGREAREFVEDTLGDEGLRRSVVVVATSDEPPPVRRQAAWTMMAVAEAFRDQGRHVLCLMDSVTRFAMAQREIGLAAAEPPATKGYTPSVFAELPHLLERAGPGGPGQGSITALCTVLVEGDDHDEPVADAVRGVLDGHIVLDRAIAEAGRYPAINVLRSVSRALPGCNSRGENAVIEAARRRLADYERMAELIRLGAYRHGSDPDIDAAIRLQPSLSAFLAQAPDEHAPLGNVYRDLEAILAEAPAAQA